MHLQLLPLRAAADCLHIRWQRPLHFLHASVTYDDLCEQCGAHFSFLTLVKSARSPSHHKEGSPEAGEVIEDGEIAQQPAVPASAARNADRAPAAAQRKAAAKAAPAPKPPLQFRMPELQRGKAQQAPDLQHAPLPAFTDATSPEQNTPAASSTPGPTTRLAPSAAPEIGVPLPQPSLNDLERNPQQSLPASDSTRAHQARQQSSERHEHGGSHEGLQRDARARRGMAEGASHRSARSRGRGAADRGQRTDSARARSSMEREPSSHASEQPNVSAAERAQREMAPMVSDMEKLLSFVSLQTIRKCVTRHCFSVFRCSPSPSPLLSSPTVPT